MKHKCPECGRINEANEKQVEAAKNGESMKWFCHCGETYYFLDHEYQESVQTDDFHSKMVQCIEGSLFKFISKGEFFQNNYQNRIDVMPLVKSVYSKMDHERLEALIVRNLEEAVAKKIVDKLTTEMGTDIKNLMSNATIRDDFRFYMRKEVQHILDKVREPDKE